MSNSEVMEFPVEFPVKIMGQDTPDFHTAIAAIVTEHVAPIDTLEVSRQPSSAGRYVSVTVTFTAESRAQLDALYRALSRNEHVLIAL